ncbi:hypothetical protein EMIHUDRAFT_216921 [Emiliania huxleyi CCMP1516]|uniref:Uncharacterized protein n=2 Tax=Emiliania huxleyi TaxID=2903 RepID=A0A0D3ICU2_EMIH1|nr:hypothetical protein EMIHUDRAFT_216921 [Emiliania huxleyi CCMP1516]EOD09077.1 hypothetical protein EMIHUDRAFT_216921 [Emiliania huxleyi CCMP1516]|eukprot:XP_005761506.1 hypothetical protein EMIHUDRAFT_216921 [Emiliania huxleyi CCMP1516]
MERLVSNTSNSRLSRRSNEAVVEPSVEASVELSDTAACGSNGGVTVRHLKSLLARADLTWTTAQFVKRVVKPLTEGRECRYVDLPAVRGESGVVGKADAFASHCWQGSFADLVAAIAYVLDEDQRVWVDALAVNQHPHTPQHKSDVKRFAETAGPERPRPIRPASLSVAAMSADDARAGKIKLVPPAERKRCAFWRVWCLVELAAALAENKPVVMLVGSRQPSGEFEPDPRMLDVALILDAMLPQILGLADRVQAPLQSTPSASPPFSPSCCASQAVRAVNALAKGALTGAMRCMRRPEILRAALGRTAPLLARSSADADRRDEMGQTALMNAAQGGHCEVVELLLAAGASVRLKKEDGFDALLLAANGSHADAVDSLLLAGADPSSRDSRGRTAADMIAEQQRLRGPTRAMSDKNKWFMPLDEPSADKARHPSGRRLRPPSIGRTPTSVFERMYTSFQRLSSDLPFSEPSDGGSDGIASPSVSLACSRGASTEPRAGRGPSVRAAADAQTDRF